MEIDELDKPRETLFEIENKQIQNSDFADWLFRTNSKYSDKSKAAGVIKKLLGLLSQNEADPEGEKSPYYNFFIAYAYFWNNEPVHAESRAKIAELEFHNRGKYLQAAISGWFLGLLLCKNGKPELAQEKINFTIKCSAKLYKHDLESGHCEIGDKDLWEKIKNSNNWILDHCDEFEQEKRDSTTDRTSSQPHLVPAFPLYGPVAAGPGEPFLHPTSKTLGSVNNDHMLNIQGKNYLVSLFVKQINSQNGNKYGWLKVNGESMNAALKLPINNDDYVLFQEIFDVRPYTGRIVIGEIADNETQPPQVVIKRLIKRGDKFFLHSESSLNEDPTTGKNYREDIEIVKDNQVEGVVIAVAKPIMDN